MTISEYFTELFYPLRMRIQLFCFSVGPSSAAMLDAMKNILYMGDSLAANREEAEYLLLLAEKEYAERVKKFNPPFERLCEMLELNKFERFVLTLALAAGIDTSFLSAVSLMQSDKIPTLGLAVKLYAQSETEVYDLQIEWFKRLKTIQAIFPSISETNMLKTELVVSGEIMSFILGVNDNYLHIPSVYTWDDIILQPQSKQALINACNLIKYREVVYDKWGFSKKTAYNKGVSMLFSGPPGTGKTMSAMIIANELKMRLHKADLSSLISKYIGETEKNLASIFEYAEKSRSILFFDEADVVFGKRSEQKDSNDRYANLQTAYLLQKFEEYDGIVILASNFSQNFDPAFFRRIHIKVDFQLPALEERAKIWQSLLIDTAPFAEDIDIEFLSSKFELSGASIKNVVLQAAFLSAANDSKIGMREIIQALMAEYTKTDKIISNDELGEYGE